MFPDEHQISTMQIILQELTKKEIQNINWKQEQNVAIGELLKLLIFTIVDSKCCSFAAKSIPVNHLKRISCTF